MNPNDNIVKTTNQEIKFLEIYGARENNLKNLNLTLPRHKLIVFTGLSGSGKTSLAFDTIYAEGQRRYIETFASYARNFIGLNTRPDVDKIEGLSPVIAIEQKTIGKNPRSTLGTTTEIYDFLRLLFSKVSTAYSYVSGEKMQKQSEAEIINYIFKKFSNNIVYILSPQIRSRKGHYKELFAKILKEGFTKVRVDGKIIELKKNFQIDRYKIHNIEIVIDRVYVDESETERIKQAIHLSFKKSKNTVLIQTESNDIYYFSKNLIDTRNNISYDEPAPNTFSFNSPVGMCPKCQGIGQEIIVNTDALIKDENLSISEGALSVLNVGSNNWNYALIKAFFKEEKLDIRTAYKELPSEIKKTLLFGSDKKVHLVHLGQEKSGSFTGLVHKIEKKMFSDKGHSELSKYAKKILCLECNGSRLKKEALWFKIDNKNIDEISSLELDKLLEWVECLKDNLTDKQNIIAKDIIKEIRTRVKLVIDIGLSYLTLKRPTSTLSGGESQRIRLATQIGTKLMEVLYIFDEPSIGLHSRDNEKLIKSLKNLRDQGNSLIVVEHDKDIMLESDYIVDIGPGAGIHGGEIIAKGTPKDFIKNNSVTSKFLSNREKIDIPKTRRKGNDKFLSIIGCNGHNLKNVSLKLPLGKLIAVTGVSGSGKSSLIHSTLYPILNREIYNSIGIPLKYDRFKGIKNIDKIVEIDQSPIGRTPRSNLVTYSGIFSLIRTIFSNLPESQIRGYKSGRFSFNVKGGRCENCEGAGIKIIEMDFLPSVKIPCEVCRKKRYNTETLDIRYKGKSISDVLEMNINDALDFFQKYPRINHMLQMFKNVGLGYLSLGQHSTTLSGGEAQRIKLASELSKKDTGNSLYILDEPTTGLHFQDIKNLISVLDMLVDKGNTVLVIEHNLDIIKVADHIIDMGPDGGAKGGEIIFEGTPEEVAQSNIGFTSKYLKKELDYSC